MKNAILICGLLVFMAGSATGGDSTDVKTEDKPDKPKIQVEEKKSRRRK